MTEFLFKCALVIFVVSVVLRVDGDNKVKYFMDKGVCFAVIKNGLVRTVTSVPCTPQVEQAIGENNEQP